MIYDIILEDPTVNVAPPERVLRLCVVEDLAFITVERYDEENGERKFTTSGEQMAVSLPALRQAVDLLSEDRTREAARERDKRGEATARIGGVRSGVVSL